MLGGLRRWRVLTVVFVFWVLFCWYAWGPGSGIIDSISVAHIGGIPEAPSPVSAPSAPSPPPKAALTGDLRYQRKNPERHPVESPVAIPPPLEKAKIPSIQAARPAEDDAAKTLRLERLGKVKETFKHSWDGYSKHAWLKDEVSPISGTGKDPFGGWSATLVDSLDTLWILGFEDEFKRGVDALDWIDFTTSASNTINVFETTIRYLGGFLAAYEISGGKYPALLKKATEVGELLMGAFDTPNRMPVTRWDWKEYVRGAQQTAGNQAIAAELGSLTLEFTKLSELTGRPEYYDAVKRISDEFELSQGRTKLPGLWPILVDASAPSFHNYNGFTIGGMSDSLYEYLPKLYLLLSGRLEQPKKMYEGFIDVAKAHLFWRTLNPGDHDIIIAGDVATETSEQGAPAFAYKYRGQHLTCFAGGMVGLASRVFDRPEDLDAAIRLTRGCVWAYNATQQKIMPEIFHFIPCGHLNDTAQECKYDETKWHKAVGERWGTKTADVTDAGEEASLLKQQILNAIKGERLAPGFVEVEDRQYALRPEAIEAVFVMYRLTGDASWAEMAWDMFGRIDRISRTPIAAAAIADVTADEPVQLDSMESFWLAETLKYFALVFSEWDVVSLDEWVLNTEAHPLKRIVK